jgi:hypothetical protein
VESIAVKDGTRRQSGVARGFKDFAADLPMVPKGKLGATNRINFMVLETFLFANAAGER